MESLITKPRVAAWISDAVGTGEPHPVAREAALDLLQLTEEVVGETGPALEQLEAAPDATVHARLLALQLQQQLAAALHTAQALKVSTEN